MPHRSTYARWFFIRANSQNDDINEMTEARL